VQEAGLLGSGVAVPDGFDLAFFFLGKFRDRIFGISALHVYVSRVAEIGVDLWIDRGSRVRLMSARFTCVYVAGLFGLAVFDWEIPESGRSRGQAGGGGCPVGRL